ncbi:MAG: glycosyltransferase family 4 protein, partial [Peptostreptococcaceae bacterium]
MKKKILIISYRMDNPGGIERVIANLANSWIKNYEVDLVSIHYPDCFYKLDDEVEKYFLNYSLPNIFKNKILANFGHLYKLMDVGRRVKKLCDEKKYDYIYTPHTVMTLIGYFFKNKNAKQFSAEHHSFVTGNSNFNKKIKSIFYKKLDKVILLTDQEEKIYKDMGCNISIIPNATSYYSEESAELNNKKIIMVGRFVDQKNYPELLEKINFFQKYPDWKLEIYGNGPHEERMKEIVKSRDISKYVEIIKSVPNIKEKYLESSMLILASKYEGLPMVLIEAMSSGLPCISFDCPTGPKKIIKHNEDGIIVENANYDELNEKIELLIKDSDLRKRLGKKAKENIKRYSAEEILKVWDKAF